MTGALLRKEWREHRAALAVLVLLLGVYVALCLVRVETHARELSRFEPVRMLAVLLATAGAHVLTSRLVVREYGARTQFFLETLPVTRGRILTTKLLLGACVLTVVLAGALAACALTADGAEPVTTRFLVLMGVRALTVSLQGYALLFLAGVLGRYRLPLLLFAMLALYMVDHLTSLDLREVGPVALLRDDFGFEQHRLPVKDVALGWAQVALCVGLAYALVLMRDGTLTGLLSERMSHREKVFITCVALGAIYATYVLDAARPKPAYTLHEARHGEAAGARVAVAPGQGTSEERADALAARLAGELAALQGYLGLQALPGVFVVPTRDLGPDVFERARLTEADGVLVRANLAHPAFDERALVAVLVREVLLWTSRGRLLAEDRQWVLDGLAAGWAERGSSPGGAPSRPLLRALWGARALPPTLDVLTGWLTTREQLGACAAGGVAHGALEALAAAAGPERTQAFLRAVLARPPGLPVWDALVEPGWEDALKETTGLDPDTLVDRWHAHLAAAAQAHAAELARLPRLEPRVVLQASSGVTWELQHTLKVETEGPAPARYALVYARLGPFDAEVPGHALQRHEVALTAPSPSTLPQTLTHGERWLWAFEVQSDVLGCALRAGAERREVP